MTAAQHFGTLVPWHLERLSYLVFEDILDPPEEVLDPPEDDPPPPEPPSPDPDPVEASSMLSSACMLMLELAKSLASRSEPLASRANKPTAMYQQGQKIQSARISCRRCLPHIQIKYMFAQPQHCSACYVRLEYCLLMRHWCRSHQMGQFPNCRDEGQRHTPHRSRIPDSAEHLEEAAPDCLQRQQRRFERHLPFHISAIDKVRK